VWESSEGLGGGVGWFSAGRDGSGSNFEYRNLGGCNCNFNMRINELKRDFLFNLAFQNQNVED